MNLNTGSSSSPVSCILLSDLTAVNLINATNLSLVGQTWWQIVHVGVSILILKKTTSAISYLEGDGGAGGAGGGFCHLL